jgi:hypothetical protein
VTTHALAATLGDREGALLQKIERHLPDLLERFAGAAVKATTLTHPGNIDALAAHGVAISRSDPDGNLIGRHRREALRAALKVREAERVAYFDLDHALRWIENDPSEFDEALEQADGYDCFVIGRGARSFAALPRRLAATESVINHIYELISGQPWDLMMAARSFSRPAAQAVVDGCEVDTIGHDVAWPLFCGARGFSLGYLEAEGLTYLTNADYAADLADSKDGDPRAWATRIRLAAQHVDAMIPYMERL